MLKDSLTVSRTRRETGALVKATKVSYMYPRILILWNSDSSFERERYRNTENKVQNRELQDWPTFIWNQKPIHVGSVAVTLRRFGETRTFTMSQTIHDSSRNASEIHECFKFAKEFINYSYYVSWSSKQFSNEYRVAKFNLWKLKVQDTNNNLYVIFEFYFHIFRSR